MGRAPGTAPMSVEIDVRFLSGVYKKTYETNVAAARPAVIALTNAAMYNTPPTPVSHANVLAADTLSRPAGTGRPRVRTISASASRSLTWLSALVPEATNAVPSRT